MSLGVWGGKCDYCYWLYWNGFKLFFLCQNARGNWCWCCACGFKESLSVFLWIRIQDRTTVSFLLLNVTDTFFLKLKMSLNLKILPKNSGHIRYLDTIISLGLLIIIWSFWLFGWRRYKATISLCKYNFETISP